MDNVLVHVPTLVRAYGRWPSFIYLLLEVTTRRAVLAGAIVALYRVLQ